MSAGTAPAGQARLWELDALRTIGMAMMVTYHVAYDIDFLSPDAGLDPFDGGWRALQVATGSTFLALVGVSYWVADRRARSHGRSSLSIWRIRAWRGAQVLGGAIGVSVATLLVLGGDDYVRFGILHLIGVLMLVVLPAVVRLGKWNALLGTMVIGIGLVIRSATSDVPGALIVGFAVPESGVDWYPLLPWAGISLLGLAVGAIAYPQGRRAAWLDRVVPDAPRAARAARAAGRHSLPFYLAHQPILIVLTSAALTASGVAVKWG